MLGNSVWASSLVLAAFMSGFAGGNAWAARRARRLSHPLRTYALLEVVVGASGLLLVLLFPLLAKTVAPLLSGLTPTPALLNTARMGGDEPPAPRAFLRDGRHVARPRARRAHGGTAFGHALGWLYGWNTLGAVAGVLATDTCSSSGSAYGARRWRRRASTWPPPCWPCSRREVHARRRPIRRSCPAPPRSRSPAGGRIPQRRRAPLALEVVWFRFLLLFFFGTGLTFAAMLRRSCSDLGRGLRRGKLAAAAAWRRPWLGALAFLAGFACIASYVGLARLLEARGFRGRWRAPCPRCSSRRSSWCCPSA